MGQHSATNHEVTAHISARWSGQIVIHRLGLRGGKRLSSPVARAGRNSPPRAVRPSALPLKYLVPSRFEPFEPDIALDGSVSMTDPGLEATLLQTPGHTAGSVSIAFPDGQAVVGDLLMGGYAGGHLFPRVPRFHYFADDPSENRRSLAKVLKTGVRRLLVGHGGPLQAEDIQERASA